MNPEKSIILSAMIKKYIWKIIIESDESSRKKIEARNYNIIYSAKRNQTEEKRSLKLKNKFLIEKKKQNYRKDHETKLKLMIYLLEKIKISYSIFDLYVFKKKYIIWVIQNDFMSIIFWIWIESENIQKKNIFLFSHF